MTTALIILFVLIQCAFAALCYGMTLGYFCREFPRSQMSDHYALAMFVSTAALVTGPFTAILIFILSGGAKHGLKFR